MGWTETEEAWGRQHQDWGSAEAAGDDNWGARCIAEAIMRGDDAGGGWGVAAAGRFGSRKEFLEAIMASEDMEGIDDHRVLRWVRQFARETWEEMGAEKAEADN